MTLLHCVRLLLKVVSWQALNNTLYIMSSPHEPQHQHLKTGGSKTVSTAAGIVFFSVPEWSCC